MTMLLRPDTTLALPDGVEYDAIERKVLDKLTFESATLNGTAALAMEVLSRGPATIDQIAEHLANRFGAPESIIEYDLADLAVHLNSANLLEVRYGRSSRTWGVLTRVLLDCLNGTLPRFRSVRYLPSQRNLAKAIFDGLAPLALASLVYGMVLTLALYVNTSGVSGREIFSFHIPALLVLIFGVGGLAHEAGHLVAAGGLGCRPAFIVRTFGSTYTVIVRERNKPYRIVALLGPIAGGIVSLVLAEVIVEVARMVGVYSDMTHALLLATVLPHCWSLTPWSADGAIIWGKP